MLLISFFFKKKSRSGQYILDLMDTYGAGFAVLWTGFWELMGLMWIYGFWNVSKDIKLMLGHREWRIHHLPLKNRN